MPLRPASYAGFHATENPHVSKKIPVLNSPWGREYERPSDCQRWIQHGHATMNGNALEFTSRFIESVMRQSAEYDPTGFDDGTARRWSRSESGSTNLCGEAALNGNLIDGRLIVSSPGGLPVLQLKRVKDVGPAKGVEHARDDLTRRQYGRDKGRSVLADSLTCLAQTSCIATIDTSSQTHVQP